MLHGAATPPLSRIAKMPVARLARAAGLVAMLLVLQGCYSLACVRDTWILKAPERSRVIVIHEWREVGAMGGDEVFLTWIVVYPLDVIIGLCVAAQAPFDPELDIK